MASVVHLNRVKVKRWKQQLRKKQRAFFVCWLQNDDNALLIAFRHQFCISLLPQIPLQAAALVCRAYAVCMTHVLTHWAYLNHRALRDIEPRKICFCLLELVMFSIPHTSLQCFKPSFICSLLYPLFLQYWKILLTTKWVLLWICLFQGLLQLLYIIG